MVTADIRVGDTVRVLAAIYHVTVGTFDLALIEDDLELVARQARIR